MRGLCVEQLGAQAACFFAGRSPVKNELTIIGASARAAAQSANRAGFAVHAADLFADLDLQRVCRAAPVSDYPDGLARAVAGPQSGSWMFTGALENSPDLVDRLADVRSLFGNKGAALRDVRRPDLVERSLREAGLPSPEVRLNAAHGEPGWLRKPLRSAGGLHITACSESDFGGRAELPGYYYQRFVAGMPCSAAYVAARGQARLLGVTRQLIAEHWTGASGFRYCGSVGPLAVTDKQIGAFARIGQVLAERFSLAGLFGVDAIVNHEGVWTVEINPRYTASMELVERSLEASLVDLHVRACLSGDLPAADVAPRHSTETFGKAIVFAEHAFTLDDDWAAFANPQTDRPLLADVPAAGAQFHAGWPVVTVLSSGRDYREVVARLPQHVAEVQRLIAAQPRLTAAHG